MSVKVINCRCGHSLQAHQASGQCLVPEECGGCAVFKFQYIVESARSDGRYAYHRFTDLHQAMEWLRVVGHLEWPISKDQFDWGPDCFRGLDLR